MNSGKLVAFAAGVMFGRVGWPWFIHAIYLTVIAALIRFR